jgi:1-aminocyclopropane-1-carboxylate deaminase/D-cysteine desulfhydrase-like pyridoxal-dependent ACC family enzyme
VLDPVYSGKALHCLLERIRQEPQAWRGKRVLFIHTGGLLVSVCMMCLLCMLCIDIENINMDMMCML